MPVRFLVLVCVGRWGFDGLNRTTAYCLNSPGARGNDNCSRVLGHDVLFFIFKNSQHALLNLEKLSLSQMNMSIVKVSSVVRCLKNRPRRTVAVRRVLLEQQGSR